MTTHLAPPAPTTRARPVIPPARATDPWNGLGALFALALRRDRVRLPLWILGLAALELFLVTSLVSVYPTASDRAGQALTIDNPGSTFLIGRIFHGDDYTYGVMTGHQTLVLLSVAAALMGILTLVRHTRAEEDSGRVELVRAASAGRYAPLTVGVLVALLAQVALALLLAGGLIALPEESVNAAGAITFAASVAAVGLVFTAVAALVAQFAATAKAASGISALVLSLSFLVRGASDVTDRSLSWLSPLGWSQKTYPWDTNDWTPLALSLVTGLLLLALAGWLSVRRDLGAPLFPRRGGSRTASAVLATSGGLAFRLNRANAVGWMVGLFIFGIVYGPVLESADDFIEQMPALRDFNPEAAAAGGLKLFASVVVGLGALLVSIPAVQVITRMGKDEESGRTALLVAGPVSRTRWYVVTVVIALLTSVVVLLAFAVGFGLSAAVAVDDTSLVGEIVRAGLGYLPAIAAVVAVAAVLIGWAPRTMSTAWVLVAWTVVVFYFSELLSWPSWVSATSPFDHVAARPAEGNDTHALVWLGVVAIALVVVGLMGYRRRPIR